MTTAKHSLSLSQKIFIYKIAIFFLVIGIFIISYQYWRLRQLLILKEDGLVAIRPNSNNIPFYKEIMDIIQPMKYTIIPSLLQQPDIKLSIDFTNQTWTLQNFHQYDSDGNVTIESHRYGLCGELASYTYNRIKPLLKNRYSVKFANVAESGFFLNPYATHVILIIYDELKKDAYLLDPTFHRYGPINDYHDYLFFSFGDKIEAMDKKQTDVSFQVNHAEPLTIRKNFISMLSIEDCNGNFDKDNFTLALRANRRYDYTGRYLFALRKNAGHIESYEDKWFENEALPPEDLNILKKKLTAWFYSLK